MLIYPQSGTVYLGQQANKMFDDFVRLWIVSYYWPYFVAGNIDEWQKMGVTLNGWRPMCFK
jgi:hypothetical protein